VTNTSEGSPPPIRSILERYETALVTYAARLTGDVEQARDVVQDTFLKLIRQGDSVRSQAPEVLVRWLYTTCRNRALDVLKKERRMKSREEAAAQWGTGIAPDPAEAVQQQELLVGVARLLEELPANQQEALRLKFQLDLPYQQIAEVMGQSLGHVGFLLHKGLHALRRKALEAEHGGARS